jgi:hypothetical protein
LAIVSLTFGLAASAQAAVEEPTLQLIGPSSEVSLYRYGAGEPVYMDLGVMVGAIGAPLELLAQRADYTQDPTLTQVLYGEGGETETVVLDPALLDGWDGLANFFELTFTKDSVEVLAADLPFCPGGYQRERIDDSGPDVQRYPSGCYSNPFTKGVVWGIDEGWAVASSGTESAQFDIANGRYEATVSIGQTYVDLFDIAAEDATVTFPLRVRKFDDGCHHRKCFGRSENRIAATGARTTQAVPVVTTPDPSTVPDLIALPSWGINVENRPTRSMLTFGATVWNGGEADLVVEGYRRDGEAIMDGFQYFYDDDGEVVGKAPAGELEYDERDGHDHWHFKQFAGYSLLDDEGNEVRRSRKEAFCLAPTDAIDMTLPSADWTPGSIGLATACGNVNSIWTREILSAGWGDTYFQGLPGQSFWITNLPNGTYYIKVEANVGGLLYETTDANNIELREIQIKGRAGNRRVVVPPWNGIDTETPIGKGGGLG